MCPTRSPSQDTNRGTCRGECSWSGPLATPPGRCHLGPPANGPGRNPPYCLRSGGADTDTGGAPKPLRSGYLTSVSCGLLSPRPPAVRCGPCLPAFFPRRVGLLCFFLFGCLASPPLVARLPSRRVGLSSAPPPCPLAVSSLSSPLFWVGGGEGGGGGGASSLSVLWRKHVASTAQARGAALVPLQGGGGLAVWLPSLPFLPCVRTPGAPPVGACTARASYGHSRVVRPASSLRCLPTLPLCPRGGGRVRPPLPSSPTLGGGVVCGGGGGGPLPSSLRSTHVAGTTQARRRHELRHLSPCRGGGACRVAPVVALPTLRSHPRWSPRWGLHGACSLRARSRGPSRTLSPLPPHHAALSSGGGALSAPPLPSSLTLGEAVVCGGGGALVVFPS